MKLKLPNIFNIRKKSNTILAATNAADPNIVKLLSLTDGISFKVNNSGDYVDKGYKKNVDVMPVIKWIAEKGSSIEWIVEERKGDEWEEINDTEFHELMHTPNKAKDMTGKDLIMQHLSWLCISGNSYIIPFGSTGFKNKVKSLDVLPSPAVTIESNNDYFMPNNVYKFSINKEYTFQHEQVIHSKMFNPEYFDITNMPYGLSPLAAAAMVVQTGNDRWEANAHVIQNKGMIGVLTDKSEFAMSPQQAEKLQESGLQQLGGSANKFGGVYFSRKSLDYIQLAMSTADLQLLETTPLTLRAVCNMYGVDSSMFNDPENKTYNNRKEAEKASYINGIKPLLDKTSAKFNTHIVPKIFEGKKIRVRPKYEDIEALREDFESKAKTQVSLVNSGIQSPKQAANNLGLDEPDETAKNINNGKKEKEEK